jgi:hypothetical protein
VAAQQASDAADARRWAGEADSLAQKVTSLTAELEAARQQAAAAQDAASALQLQQGSTERRVVELEGGSAELSQQLTVRLGVVVVGSWGMLGLWWSAAALPRTCLVWRLLLSSDAPLLTRHTK